MTFNPENRILRELEPAVALRTANDFEKVQLSRGSVLQEVGADVQWVWFPDDALISTASESIDGESVAGSMIGRDGAYGAFEACGSRISFTRALVQISGAAWKLRSSHYRDLFEQSSGVRTAIHKHIEILLVEARQLLACTALHRVESRMCRVLLEASERSHGEDNLTLTQEALANILGVQRSTIAATSSALQRGGLIQTSRGISNSSTASGLRPPHVRADKPSLMLSARSTQHRRKSARHKRFTYVFELKLRTAPCARAPTGGQSG